MTDKNNFTAKKKPTDVDVYHVPSVKYGGWTRVYIDHSCNAISYMGDYISGSYMFGSIGETTMQEFLLNLNFDYFMQKTRPGEYLQLNADQTIQQCLASVIEWHKSGLLEKSVARDFHHHIQQIETNGNMTERDFDHKFYELEYIGFHFEDGIPYVHEARHDCQMFWDGPWQALCDLWRKELEESQVAS